MKVETCPHLGGILDDKGDERTLPRKADEQRRGLDREPESAEDEVT